MLWQRLSVRTGKRPAFGPHEGVPPHLVAPLTNWIGSIFATDQIYGGVMNAEMLGHLANMNEIPIRPGSDAFDVRQAVLDACVKDQDLCLDMIDSLLEFGGGRPDGIEALSVHLTVGDSVWDTAPDGKSLTRRVSAAEKDQFTVILSTADTARAELQESWHNVYGRHRDPSDAWDHAIKAVEAVLIPIVCPKKEKATLGSVAGYLKSAPQAWKLTLDNRDAIGGVQTLEAMIRLMWPNPDRHQDGSPKRTPSDKEAQAVLHLAVTIVQWVRNGALEKR
jgi:hypothetical protein